MKCEFVDKIDKNYDLLIHASLKNYFVVVILLKLRKRNITTNCYKS